VAQSNNEEGNMRYVRSIDFDTAEINGANGYKGKILYSGESCLLIATQVPPGARGPRNHVHPQDQLYYVIDGVVTLKMGNEVRTAAAGSAAFIPAGVPHHNWNESDTPEMHLEVLAPGTVGLQPVIEFTESTESGGLPFAVVSPTTRTIQLEGGMKMAPLVSRRSGSNNALMYEATLPSGAAGPDLHIHEFDQFYVVLEGSLGVQVGFTEYTVGPQQLVVLPAGVPHRQWNACDGVERHITIITPEPEHPNSALAPWDIAVELNTASHHRGNVTAPASQHASL
jgi:quercetin dioxygenase-like cupin family protein